VVIISRAQVIDARDAINAWMARMGYAEPVPAKGTAIAERIITSADRSSLYNSAEPGALRRQVLAATEALDTAPRADLELPMRHSSLRTRWRADWSTY
jgi:hypothetical protein